MSSDIAQVQHGPSNESCAGCAYFFRPPSYPDTQPGVGACLRYPPDKGALYSWTNETYWCGEYKQATAIT